MFKSSSPEHLSSGRPHPANLLRMIGSIGMQPDFELSPEEEDVIKTSYRVSSQEELDLEDLKSAQAFEQLHIYHPLAATDPELYID